MPIRLFRPAQDGDDLAGSWALLSARAASLFAYLCTVMDQDTGRIPGSLADWSRPELHGRDPATVRRAFGELLGDRALGCTSCAKACKCDGPRLALLERHDGPEGSELFAGGLYWEARCRVRGKRHTTATGTDGWVQFRASVIRGGPWAALTDSARKLWIALIAVAADQTRQTKKGERVASEAVSRERLAARSGVCSRTIAAALPSLEAAGLVVVERRRRSIVGRFKVNAYRAISRLIAKINGRSVDFNLRIADQLRGTLPGRARQSQAWLAAYWWRRLRGNRPPPARLSALLG